MKHSICLLAAILGASVTLAEPGQPKIQAAADLLNNPGDTIHDYPRAARLLRTASGEATSPEVKDTAVFMLGTMAANAQIKFAQLAHESGSTAYAQLLLREALNSPNLGIATKRGLRSRLNYYHADPQRPRADKGEHVKALSGKMVPKSETLTLRHPDGEGEVYVHFKNPALRKRKAMAKLLLDDVANSTKPTQGEGEETPGMVGGLLR